MKSKYAVLFVIVMVALSTMACISSSVKSHESGVIYENGKIKEIVGPGFQFSLNPMKTMDLVNHEALTFDWYDPSLVTQDK